MLDGLAPQNL